MVFILWVNTNPENWSVNTQLTGIRRNMIHLENSWSLSWKILAEKLESKHSTQWDTQTYDSLGKLLVAILESFGRQIGVETLNSPGYAEI